MAKGFNSLDVAGRVDSATTSAAAANGVITGSLIDMGVISRPVVQIVIAGAITSQTTVLEGSLDGTNFFTLATTSITTGNVILAGAANLPCRYTRLTVSNYVGSGTVTGTIAAVPV